MSKDYRVNRRSDAQVRDIAIKTRLRYGQHDRCPVDILQCLNAGWVHTEFGKKPLRLDILDDREMKNDDARTEYVDGIVVVSARRSVCDRASWGEGRSRMTLSHELGHAAMHPGASKSRSVGQAGFEDYSEVRPFESAEHQAKVFGPAFLINDDLAINFSDERISEEFGISWEAAKIYCERRAEKKQREEKTRLVTELNKHLQSTIGKPFSAKRYIPDPCPVCTNSTLCRVDAKYWCDTCKALRDPFADGDLIAK